MSFPPPVGYGATELAKAYGLTNAGSADGTIVVIGAGAGANLESDLNVYRGAYNLPPCTTANGQPAQIAAFCNGHRVTSDASAVSDPHTGVAVYDSYAPGSGEPVGFIVVGGTSAASPFLRGLYARAPHNAAVEGPNTLYATSRSNFNDVTIGTNAGLGVCQTKNIGKPVCEARPGWDGPTGLGTPKGLAPFTS